MAWHELQQWFCLFIFWNSCMFWVFLAHSTRVYSKSAIFFIIYWIYSSYKYSCLHFFFSSLVLIESYIEGEFLLLTILLLSSYIFLSMIISCVYVLPVPHMFWWVLLSVLGNTIPFVNLWQKGGVKIGEWWMTRPIDFVTKLPKEEFVSSYWCNSISKMVIKSAAVQTRRKVVRTLKEFIFLESLVCNLICRPVQTSSINKNSR